MNDTITILGQQIPVALVLLYVQNWMKRQAWMPWITYETSRVNNIVAIVLSGLATIGIHVAHTGTLSAGSTITFTLPPLSVLVVSLWHWIQQYVLTKTAHSALAAQLDPRPSVPASK